jgi:hypothetical protein
MAAKGAKKQSRKRAASPKKPRAIATPKVDMRTDERRERVLELWGKPTRLVAKMLLEEGFEVDAGPQPVTKEKQDEWTRHRVELMRRNVDNDRGWWREKWRADAKTPKTSEDLEVELESNIAAINSDVDEISELLTDAKTKSSAKAILFQSKLRARELVLKARGLDKAPEREPDDPDAGVKRPTLIVYDLSNCSDDLKKKYGNTHT